MNSSWRLTLPIGLLLLLEAGYNQPPAQNKSSSSSSRSAAYIRLLEETHTQSEEGLPDKCGLAVITYALNNRDALAAPLRSAAQVLLTRPVLQKSIVAGNFRIHYDTLGLNEPALLDAFRQRIPRTANEYADSVGAILRYVALFEIGSLGYPAPPPDGTEGGGPEYDVYILELGSLYGYTTPEISLNNKPDGAMYTTFISIDNDFSFVAPDSNKGLPALRVTLAHEFHHAIQIGEYGYWTSDVYYYEMTSTWMEDMVFPNVNDYMEYLKSGSSQFRSPGTPFTVSNQSVEYSRAVWCHFIAKYFGRDAVKRSWEEIRGARPLQAIDNALQSAPYGSSFRNAFVEWTLWNYYTGNRNDTVHYYPEGDRYPLIAQTPVEFTPPSRDVDGSLGPMAARYYQVMAGRDTLTLALSNINFGAAVSNSGASFPYIYHLNVSQVDQSYQPTATLIFYKLDAPDQTNWYTWDIFRGTPGPSMLATGAPFPNPLTTDGRASIFIPVLGSGPIRATVSIFSSSMDLVYTSTATSSLRLGKQVFVWNGMTSTSEAAQSGIYFYVVEAGNQTNKGKFALIRK
jgi:hypothetical protein